MRSAKHASVIGVRSEGCSWREGAAAPHRAEEGVDGRVVDRSQVGPKDHRFASIQARLSPRYFQGH